MAFDDSKQPNFDSAKATRGSKPYVDPTSEKPAGISAEQSNQERGTGTGERTVKPDTNGVSGDTYSDTNRRNSGQARFQENQEVPTDSTKNPLNSYLRKVLPAVQNPDAGNDRSYSRKAVGRVVGSKRSL